MNIAPAVAVTPIGVVAQAATPPAINPALAPRPGLPAQPPGATEQRSQCARPTLTGLLPHAAPGAQAALDLSQAWQFSRGQGQRVAVIDTGVSRHPRLPALIPGGDYVSGSDGTVDCDGHGTLVAGIIAAQPGPDDGFAGVAPDAAIVSIRQLSLEYADKDYSHRDGPGKMSPGGVGTVQTLALAILHAADMGATVINISEVSCAAAGTEIGDGVLGAAVKYAYDHNIVVVTAAGNVENDGACKTQNGSGWAGVQTIASPAWFSPYVLAVGAVDHDGSPAQFSLAGPWVQVAAPGVDLYSLDSTPGRTGLVNAIPGQEGRPAPIDGTSFSSAFVAGVAALVRARFPGLSAQQVMDRIVRTAHAAGGGHDDRIGYGIVDPVAALTAQLPDAQAASDLGVALPRPAQPPTIDPRPRAIALGGAVICLLALAVGTAVTGPFRGKARRKMTEDVDY
ncbi:type VII secretion-associated serine protease mycosin [Nocardia sp. GAS34]|uniref:type VII secretion-associated serine protease mycosin n=1 Tax=unclassified Nocardia TaxID=2637762 RepID=UPI003D1D08FF